MASLELEVLDEGGRLEEVSDVVVGEVACLVLELVEREFDLDTLHLFDSLGVLLVDSLFLHHLVEDVKQQLVWVGFPRLVGLELLLELASH